MSAISSVSLRAGTILRSNVEGNEDMILMGPGVYIHNMTPAIARQWIETLTPITEEEN